MSERAQARAGSGRSSLVTVARCGMLLLAGLAVAAFAEPADTKPPTTGPTAADASAATIHQEVDVEASPDRIYRALLDAKQFGALTGLPTEIAPEVGGAFECFGGHIVGRNVELVPDRRIVQAWRVATWPEGVYSIARFELKPRQAGTHVVFDHTGFPPELRDHLAAGWEDHYWKALRTVK